MATHLRLVTETAPEPSDSPVGAIWQPWTVEQLHRTAGGMVHIEATIPDGVLHSMMHLLQQPGYFIRSNADGTLTLDRI